MRTASSRHSPWPRTDNPPATRAILDISLATLHYSQEADQTISPDIWGCDYFSLEQPQADIANQPVSRNIDLLSIP
jgi:hypothetical protein